MVKTAQRDYTLMADRGCKPIRDQYGAGSTCELCPRFPEPCLLDFIEERDYEGRRERQTPRAVRMLRRGMGKVKVAAVVGCSRPTLNRWLRIYREEQ
jgi:hypothetical protein